MQDKASATEKEQLTKEMDTEKNHNNKIKELEKEVEERQKEIDEFENVRSDLQNQNEKNLARKESWKKKHQVVAQAL